MCDCCPAVVVPVVFRLLCLLSDEAAEVRHDSGGKQAHITSCSTLLLSWFAYVVENGRSLRPATYCVLRNLADHEGKPLSCVEASPLGNLVTV